MLVSGLGLDGDAVPYERFVSFFSIPKVYLRFNIIIIFDNFVLGIN